MSSMAPTKRERIPNTSPSGKGVLDWLGPIFTSQVGNKILIAITGTLLVGFVVGHLIGNLKVFAGPDSINAYAKFLKDQGPLLWMARAGLLILFVLHLILAIRLKSRSAAARPTGYAYPGTIQASTASRSMVLTGLVILAFVVFHIAHYTLGMVKETADGTNYLDLVDSKGRHDVYRMVISGFTNPVICVLYLVAQLLLFVHLSHGISSVFQTLGLNTPQLQPFVKKLGYAIAGLIFVGNTLIVVAVWMKWITADTWLF